MAREAGGGVQFMCEERTWGRLCLQDAGLWFVIGFGQFRKLMYLLEAEEATVLPGTEERAHWESQMT